MPWPWASTKNKYESDLSNEVLYDLLDQEAAKISEVKVGNRKKSSRSTRHLGASVLNLAESAISYQPPALTSDIFAASLSTRVYSALFERYNSYLSCL